MMKISPDARDAIRTLCRKWRIENRYPMTRIAEIAGVSRQAVRSFELKSGHSKRMIAAYIQLGLPVSNLIEASGLNVFDILEGGSENGEI